MYFRFCICFKFTVCTFVHLLCVWLYILNFNLVNIYETNFCCIFFLLFTTSSWEVRHLLNKSFSPTRNKSEKSFCSKKKPGKMSTANWVTYGYAKNMILKHWKHIQSKNVSQVNAFGNYDLNCSYFVLFQTKLLLQNMFYFIM